MKKLLILISLFFMFILPLYAQEEKPNIAVIDFKALGVPATDAVFASEFLRTALVKSNRFRVIEKANMDRIMTEQGFQQTGCTSSDCAVQLGKVLNVKKMITGSFGKFGEIYQIVISVVDVESGEIVYSNKKGSESIQEVSTIVDELAKNIVSILTGETIEQNPPVPVQEEVIEAKPVLVLSYGKLLIKTNPPNSTIIIDWAEVGKSNSFGDFTYEELETGKKHTIEVTHIGFLRKTEEISIEPGEIKNMAFSLVNFNAPLKNNIKSYTDEYGDEENESNKDIFVFVGVTAGLAGLGAVIAGEIAMSGYNDASSPSEAIEYRNAVEVADLIRNISFGISGASFGVIFLFP